MRALFLLAPLVAVLAACGSSPQPAIPTIQPTTPTPSSEQRSGTEIVEKDLARAGFGRPLDTTEWVRSGVRVAIQPKDEFSFTVTATFDRADGRAICEVQATKFAFVAGIESLDDVQSAAELINRYSCQAA